MWQKRIDKILNGRQRRLRIYIRLCHHALIDIADTDLINLLLIVLTVEGYIKRYHLNIIFLS